MKDIFNILPIGILVTKKGKIYYINEKAKEFLGLSIKGDPITIGTVQGRMGINISEAKEEEEIKILNRKFVLNKIIYKDKIILLISQLKEKEDNLAYVSHEIRVPLSSIIGSIQAILDGLKGSLNEKQKDFLEIALRNSLRIKEIVEEIFDFKRIEKGTDKFEFCSFDLREFVEECINSFIVAGNEKNLKVVRKYDDKLDSYFGYADKKKIMQVFTNILINSYTHSFENSEILVEIDISKLKDKNYAKFSVTNEGKEISPDLREKIFDFYQHFSSYKGLGLGLPIAKKIIEKHEGEIDFTSANGKTKFYFTFPAVEKLKKKILFVEDDMDLQVIVKSYLESLGYEVKTAISGNEAIRIMEKFFPDLVITDLLMPDGTGWDFIKKIGQWERKPKMIVLSGMKSAIDHFITLDILKVDSFISKPFEIKDLVYEVDKIFKEGKK